jgi:hypothetical protein
MFQKFHKALCSVAVKPKVKLPNTEDIDVTSKDEKDEDTNVPIEKSNGSGNVDGNL